MANGGREKIKYPKYINCPDFRFGNHKKDINKTIMLPIIKRYTTIDMQ